MKWLSRLLDKGTPLDQYTAEAANWSTCAVGEAHDAMPLVVEVSETEDLNRREPLDARLNKLGRDFYTHVKMGRRSRALTTYLAIQARIARLAGGRA